MITERVSVLRIWCILRLRFMRCRSGAQPRASVAVFRTRWFMWRRRLAAVDLELSRRLREGCVERAASSALRQTALGRGVRHPGEADLVLGRG
jgi:hypothetical protein